jgi:membrane protease YdiL (CAAX protease family)
VEVTGGGRLAAWAALVGVLAALNYAGRFAADETSDDLLYTWGAFVAGVIQFAVVLGLVLAIARGLPARATFALVRPASWPRAGGIAVLVLVAVFAVAGVLEPFVEPSEEQGLVPERWDPDRAAPFAANCVLVAGIAPVVEELTFRGLGFSLLERYGQVAAVLLVGIAFGLVHGLVGGLPILAVFGVGLAWLRSRSGSVYPPILLHALFNAAVLAVAVAQ